MAMLPSSEPDRKRTPDGAIANDHTVDVWTGPLLLGPKVAAQYQSPDSSAQMRIELS